MTTAIPVEEIVRLLINSADYRKLEMPITVASIQFQFSAALVGTDRIPDLVIVADTNEELEQRIRQKILALARALDVVGSRRPLTVILVGPRPSTAMLNAVSRVSRVLPVGTDFGTDTDQTLCDWLSVLLPLQIPPPAETIDDPLSQLRQCPAVSGGGAVAEDLISAASLGAEHVRDRFCKLIAEALDDANRGDI